MRQVVLNKVLSVLADCTQDMSSKLSKTILLILAVTLGIGTLTASVGMNLTASKQISNDIAASILDQVIVSVSQGGSTNTNAFPSDAPARALGLNKVQGAALSLVGETAEASPARFSVLPRTPVESSVRVVGVTSQFFEVMEVTGGTQGSWALSQSEITNVVFLGKQIAEELGVPVGQEYPRGFKIWLYGEPLDVVGIVQSSARYSADNTIFVPYALTLLEAGSDTNSTLTVRTALGAGALVSEQVRQAVRPDAPELLLATKVATLESLQSGVDNQLGKLGVSVGAMLLLLTALLIANSMIVSVTSRTAEIGLRRALGSSQSAIARLFIVEGALTGLLGGVAGAGAGIMGTIILSISNQWSPQIPLWLAPVGIILGGVVGVCASLYPALSAARVDPATAIRTD